MSGSAFYLLVAATRRARCKHRPPAGRRCARCEGGAFVIPGTAAARVLLVIAWNLGTTPGRCARAVGGVEVN